MVSTRASRKRTFQDSQSSSSATSRTAVKNMGRTASVAKKRATSKKAKRATKSASRGRKPEETKSTKRASSSRKRNTSSTKPAKREASKSKTQTARSSRAKSKDTKRSSSAKTAKSGTRASSRASTRASSKASQSSRAQKKQRNNNVDDAKKGRGTSKRAKGKKAPTKAPAKKTPHSPRRTRGGRSNPMNIDLFNLSTPGKSKRKRKQAPEKKAGKSKKARKGSKARRGSKKKAAVEEESSDEEQENKIRIPMPRSKEKAKSWSIMEVRALLEGVNEFGESSWAQILGAHQEILVQRTQSDLRLKYRSLLNANSEKENKELGSRRKPVAWNEAETETLKELVQEYGEGHWKKILAAGKGQFDKNRQPSDLKDKWRSMNGRNKAAQRPKRMYKLLHSKGVIFNNRFPRDAALKAASRGWPRIALLDLTAANQTVHLYQGQRVEKDVKQIKNRSVRNSRFKNVDTFWVPHVSKVGTKSLAMYLKQNENQKPPVPAEVGRKNRGGRPSADEKEAKGKKGKGMGKSKAKKGKGKLPTPLTEEETRAAQSDEEELAEKRGKIFGNIAFMMTRVDDSSGRIAKKIKKMGGVVCGSIKQASSLNDDRNIVVLAPRPLLTRKYIFSLARGLAPLAPDFVDASMEKKGLANPLKYALSFGEPMQNKALPVPQKWASLVRRQGIKGLDFKKRTLFGITVGAFNLSEEQRLVLEEAGAEVMIVDRISTKLPKNIDCIVSGEYGVFANGCRKDIVQYSWVTESLLVQRAVKKTDEFLCEVLDADTD